MAIIGIVAVDQQGAIGQAGAVPWHFPADMKFFREQTTGHACVMGRRTWLSLKRPLRDRLNLVLSHRADFEAQPGVLTLRDKVSVLALHKYLACDLYVIGGAEIYREFLPEIDRWLVTKIPLTIADADTRMPADYLQDFRPRDARPLDDGLTATFYERAATG